MQATDHLAGLVKEKKWFKAIEVYERIPQTSRTSQHHNYGAVAYGFRGRGYFNEKKYLESLHDLLYALESLSYKYTTEKPKQGESIPSEVSKVFGFLIDHANAYFGQASLIPYEVRSQLNTFVKLFITLYERFKNHHIILSDLDNFKMDCLERFLKPEVGSESRQAIEFYIATINLFRKDNFKAIELNMVIPDDFKAAAAAKLVYENAERVLKSAKEKKVETSEVSAPQPQAVSVQSPSSPRYGLEAPAKRPKPDSALPLDEGEPKDPSSSSLSLAQSY